MPDDRSTFPLLCLTLLLVLAACRTDRDRSPTGRGMTAQSDTARLENIYQNMDQDYDRLMERYEEMRAQMPSDVQQMYRYMQQMHEEANAMHQQMMQNGMMHGRGMMGRDGEMMGMMSAREWDQQMMGMHGGLAQMHARTGQEEMAQIHHQMTEWYRRALENTPSEGTAQERPESAAPESAEEATVNGANLFAQQCATCHGPQGAGGGAFPPLAGSEWVTEDKETPIRVVLHGLQGRIQVNGRSYSGLMPAFRARLSNEEVAAILTHIRSSWGNEAPEVTAREVQELRQKYSDRTHPWSPSAFQ